MPIHRKIKRGNFTAALALISQLRKPDSLVYDNIMYDNFEAIANLHLRRLTLAADTIDRVLAAAGGGPHLHEHLKLSCGPTRTLAEGKVSAGCSWSVTAPATPATSIGPAPTTVRPARTAASSRVLG